jgi:phosphotransferase system IIB component
LRYGDIEGKGKIYSETGKLILIPQEKILASRSGTLKRGWVRYKVGWRTIIFKGYGSFNITSKRIIYIEEPQYIQKIHTFNLDHEIGDFGGWDYHAHRMRRATRLQALMFLELPYEEITKFKHKDNYSTVFTEDKNHKYKIIIDSEIAKAMEQEWNKHKPDVVK